jgi:hypothetical protein
LDFFLFIFPVAGTEQSSSSSSSSFFRICFIVSWFCSFLFLFCYCFLALLSLEMCVLFAFSPTPPLSSLSITSSVVGYSREIGRQAVEGGKGGLERTGPGL